MPIKLKLSTKRNYNKKKSTKLKGGWGEPLLPIKPISKKNKKQKGKKQKDKKQKDKKQKDKKQKGGWVKKLIIKKKQKGGWGGKPRFYTSD